VLIELVENEAEHTTGDLSLTGMCRDPKDDIFLACAVEGEAECIVSGDADLMDLGSYKTPKSSDLAC
jgi:putative PIN family toxin of toxin-antitoxin system